MSSIFTKIVNGEIPCFKIAESEKFLAFLDINPLKKGHCLVIPKEEIDYFFDIDDDLISELVLFAKRVAKAIKLEIECERIGMSIIGLEVPHAHIHLVPINGVHDLNFSNVKVSCTKEEMENIAQRIAAKVEL